ncbi:MAG: tRNA guanosine(34) transglycosylase Tgt [Candidatus Omnitrophica bacterium]|nr:tRNA guanosine(34) transglycosylase Tgt [Candidatus Omnitrophota bacterium]
MEFKISAQDGSARLGELSFTRGKVTTPVFLPVATRGAVRCLSSENLIELGYEMVLANAYHLSMRPGTKVISAAGGLHSFMNWQRPILTDSGGFQIFSLEDTKIDDTGAVFRSIYDGSWHQITPEEVVRIQEDLGVDIIMPLDQPVAYPVSESLATEALVRTTTWAKRCKTSHRKEAQALFGIVQGSTYPALRKRSAEEIINLDFPGYSLGGFCLGEPKQEMNELVSYTAQLLPAEKPRYLMGIGTPLEIISAVGAGIDIFDCTFPTHIARNGSGLTGRGKIIIRNSTYREDSGPLDPDCACFVCRKYQRGYLRHLLNTKELTVLYLITYHNLYFMQNLMRRIQAAIGKGKFLEFQKEFGEKWSSGL